MDLIDQVLGIEGKVGTEIREAKVDQKIEIDLSQVPMVESQGLCHLREVTQMKEMKNVRPVAVGILPSNVPFTLMESLLLVKLARVFIDLICVLIEV